MEVGRLSDQPRGIDSRLSGTSAPADKLAEELRRALYGHYAPVKVHMAREEEVHLPLPGERLSQGAADQVFVRMEATASAAKREADRR